MIPICFIEIVLCQNILRVCDVLKHLFVIRTYETPVRGQMAVFNNKVLCVRYRDQKFDPDFIFPSTRLPGAKDPPDVLKPGDLHPNNSNDFQFRGRGRGSGRGNI